jgi:hypothetical protein
MEGEKEEDKKDNEREEGGPPKKWPTPQFIPREKGENHPFDPYHDCVE